MTIQRTIPRPTEPSMARRTVTTGTATRGGISAMYERVLTKAAELLARHSIDALRISLGLVFLGFGVQKFFPGVSPAEPMAVRTVEALTFGIASGGTALLLTAIVETFIGITMLTGKFVKVGLLALGAALFGMMATVVLFFGEMFPGGGAPTLEAQYIMKDIILAAAGTVIAAKALGARLRTEHS